MKSGKITRSSKGSLRRLHDIRVQEVITLLKSWSYFTNSANVTVVQSVEIDGTNIPIPIGDRKFRAVVSRVAQNYLQISLRENELSSIQNYFIGVAVNAPKQLTPDAVINESSLLEAVYLLLISKPSKEYKASAKSLLIELRQIANQEGLDQSCKQWPKAANLLSKQLELSRSNLQHSGIELNFGRSGGGNRFVELRMLCDDSGDVASHASSPTKSKQNPGLAIADDSDDEIFKSIESASHSERPQTHPQNQL